MFGRVGRSLAQWAQGSPPMNEKVYQTIYNKFNIVLYLSGLFLDLRPKYWVLTAAYASFMYLILLFYTFVGLKTLLLQIHDFPRAAETALLLLIITNLLLGVAHINFRRSHFVGLFHSMSEDYFNYGDGEEINEMGEEFKRSRRQKIYVLIVCPVYMTVAAVVTVTGRPMDVYFGAVSDEAYEDGVYMLTPRPAWYPFTISNDMTHYLILFSQLCVAEAVAAYYTGYLALIVGFCQSLALQLKLLKYRIKKIPQLAYKLHIKRKGTTKKKNELDQREVLDDPNYRECYNTYLRKCAAHHAIIIRNFTHLRRIHEWQCYLGILTVTTMMGLSLLLLVVERTRPSIILFGFMAFAICILNVGIMCWQTEHVMEISESVGEELYDSNWMDVDQRAKKTMMIMIERIKQPLVLEAAVSGTPLNWETYAAMFNSAYSYVNVLRAARQSE